MHHCDHCYHWHNHCRRKLDGIFTYSAFVDDEEELSVETSKHQSKARHLVILKGIFSRRLSMRWVAKTLFFRLCGVGWHYFRPDCHRCNLSLLHQLWFYQLWWHFVFWARQDLCGCFWGYSSIRWTYTHGGST